MNEQLSALIAEKAAARADFVRARFLRDAASVYYDSVVTEVATVTQPAWDSFSEKQSEMDVAGDHLFLAQGAIFDHVLRSRA